MNRPRGAPDPLTQAAILEGHRRLLESFRGFRMGREPEEHEVDEEGVDLDEIRATAAFLRQEILPFSRWEEGALGEDEAAREPAAFEHAFLAAEIDAFAREATALASAERGRDGGARRMALHRLLRRAHRIEAVLELHGLRAEDRGIVAGPGPATS